MKAVQITSENLFKLISQEEGISYELEQEYFQKTPLQILNENTEWVSINGLIQKKSKVIKFELDVDKTLVCADKHIMLVDGSNTKYANELKIGDYISNVYGSHYIITDIAYLDEEEIVYDMEVDNSSHLYTCSLGIIHHNTLLTSAIVKYANMLNMRTITIVPSSSLLKQTHDYIKQFDIPVGMFGGGKKDDAPNIVATWQTLQNNKSFIKDFECIIWDECVHPSSMIRLADNTEKRIDELQVGELVKTINEITKQIEDKPIKKIHKNLLKSHNQKMFRVTMENDSIIELTGNHEVLTIDDWKRTDALTIHDRVLNTYTHTIQIKKIEEINYIGDVYNLHIEDNHNYFVDSNCVKNCHGAKAFVAQQIMQQASDSYMRIGLTGTIPKNPMDKMNLTSGFGPVVYEVKAHDLQKKKILSSIHINIFELLYPKEYINSFIDWADETNFLQSNPMFQSLVKTILGTLEGNTLILMKNIDPASDLASFLGCTYISSKLNVDKRQEKFNEFVHGGNHIAVGTYSLLSTGIDIVHIHNLILAPTPGKSFTKCIQSIGRGLRRKTGQKEHINVIDLTSNLKFDRKHIKNRKDYYTEAKYPFETDKIDMIDVKIKTKKKK